MNIKIRALKLSDLDDIVELRSATKAQRETLQLPYPSPELIKKKIESLSPHDHFLVAEAEESGRVVGSVGLNRVSRPRQAHIGYLGMAVHDDFHNQGVGSKLMAAIIDLADRWLNLTRLELTVYVDNAPAVHLYEKFGFKKEGTLRKYAYRDGQYVDAYMMARIRD